MHEYHVHVFTYYHETSQLPHTDKRVCVNFREPSLTTQKPALTPPKAHRPKSACISNLSHFPALISLPLILVRINFPRCNFAGCLYQSSSSLVLPTEYFLKVMKMQHSNTLAPRSKWIFIGSQCWLTLELLDIGAAGTLRLERIKMSNFYKHEPEVLRRSDLLHRLSG